MEKMDNSKKENLRLLLLGDKDIVDSDELIDLLFEMATKRFLFLISNVQKSYNLPIPTPALTAPPEELAWILDEVIVRRFNRIGSEGFTAQSVEGHSVSFSTDDFTGYLTDIATFYEPSEYQSRKAGKVVYF